MTVARTGNVEAAKLLIKARAKVNAVEQWRGQTALMWASAQGNPGDGAPAAEVRRQGRYRVDAARLGASRDGRTAAAEPSAGRVHGAAAGRARRLRRLRAGARAKPARM